MTEQPQDHTGADDLNVVPDVPGPSGTGEETDRGGDPDAAQVTQPGQDADNGGGEGGAA